ncbi:MAG TPA: hypothetical protein VK196_20200 [Magnetospirillum sp.]|nr:hypothetical protein [Magnetospirillum sp.]
MSPLGRKLWGGLGALLAVAAVAPLAVGGICTYSNLTVPRGDFTPGPQAVWVSVPLALVSLLVIWLGVRLCRWGFRRPVPDQRPVVAWRAWGGWALMGLGALHVLWNLPGAAHMRLSVVYGRVMSGSADLMVDIVAAAGPGVGLLVAGYLLRRFARAGTGA